MAKIGWIPIHSMKIHILEWLMLLFLWVSHDKYRMWGHQTIAKLVFKLNKYGLWYTYNYSIGENKPTFT